MKKAWIAPICILIIFLLVFTMASYANKTNENMAKEIVRLHVLANSDSAEDQALKYKVRDNLLDYMRTHDMDINQDNKEMMKSPAFLQKLEDFAEETVRQNGKDYNVNVDYGRFPFPTKTYEDLTFPAGYYDAVKVVIGDGEGQNWWCVMYPPLCMLNETTGVMSDESKQLLKDKLSQEDYALLGAKEESAPSDIKIKFKIVEIMETIKMQWEAFWN